MANISIAFNADFPLRLLVTFFFYKELISFLFLFFFLSVTYLFIFVLLLKAVPRRGLIRVITEKCH